MIVRVKDFDDWRRLARSLIAQQISPAEVSLRHDDGQPMLFAGSESVDGSSVQQHDSQSSFTVPRAFVSLAQDVAYHSDPRRWDTLYRALWRLRNEQPNLLELATDDDIHELHRMEKQVRRDAHKMKAFVRFRKITRAGGEHFIAWHRPDHHVLRKVAPFFSRRFKGMNWSILTPRESATWDQQQLHFGPGVPRSEAPDSDELEDLWRTYYASIFNPARVKVKAMKNEMPVRYWSTMPETKLIPELLEKAVPRLEGMIAKSEGYQSTAAEFIERCEQERPIQTLSELASLAARCTACDLHCHATQTVFGEGPATARMVIVGEQPGDVEDRAGRPFVGPAGEVLNDALAEAGIPRHEVYLTNVVKHFKFTEQTATHPREMRGKKRLHKRPNAMEVRVCKPWLAAEWSLLTKPAVLVCLGATAATALITPEFKVSKDRGTWFESRFCSKTIATWHPSAILRTPDDARRRQMMSQLTHDLRLASECHA